MGGSERYGPAWPRLRKQRMDAARATDEPCCRCGRPIDYQLKGNTPWGPTVDHLDPLSLGGDINPDMNRLAPAHLRCNSRHGGRIKSNLIRKKNATDPIPETKGNPRRKSAKGNSERGGNAILSAGLPSPSLASSESLYPTKVTVDNGSGLHDIRTPWTGYVRDPGDLDGLPRLFPAPHPDAAGSYGDHATEWIEARMREDGSVRAAGLRWFQWLILQRLLEHRADGSWCWPVSFVSVSRQQGKSELLCEIAAWRCAHPDLFGGWPQEVGHSASTVVVSRQVQSSRWPWAAGKDLEVHRQLGDSQIRWPDRSTWRTMAPENMYGRSMDLILADEAWHWEATAFWQATFPTMVERPQSQSVMWSAAHDTPKSLVSTLIGNPDVGVMMWGAAPGADMSDPAVWRASSAFWSQAREAAMRIASTQASFSTQWLNVWPSQLRGIVWGSALARLLPPGADKPWTGPVSLALESDIDGTAWGAAASDGVHVVCVSTERKGEALKWLQGHAPGATAVMCHDAVARLMPPDFPVPVEKMSTAAARSATSLFKDAVGSGQLSWDRVLPQQLEVAEVSGGSGMEYIDAGRSKGSVSALKAATWALWRAASVPAVDPVIY